MRPPSYRDNAPHSGAVQVLQALSNPTYPRLEAMLRLTTITISAKQHCGDLSLWLEGGIFTHLLNIMRALPTLGLDPDLATYACTSAAAILCNIIHLTAQHEPDLPSPFTVDYLLAEAGSLDIVTALIKHGMLAPIAVRPLPAGRDVHMEDVPGYIPYATVDAFSKDFWTPLRVCGHLLASVVFGSTTTTGASTRLQSVLRFKAATGALVGEVVFQHLLETSLEYSGSKLPPLC
jgi:hypothetical protein